MNKKKSCQDIWAQYIVNRRFEDLIIYFKIVKFSVKFWSEQIHCNRILVSSHIFHTSHISFSFPLTIISSLIDPNQYFRSSSIIIIIFHQHTSSIIFIIHRHPSSSSTLSIDIHHLHRHYLSSCVNICEQHQYYLSSIIHISLSFIIIHH